MLVRSLKTVVSALAVMVVTGSVMLAMLGVTPAHAHDVPDMSRTATISVTMRDGADSVSGGTLVACKVGKIVEDDGNYSFAPVYALSGSDIAYDNIQSAQLAADLAAYIEQNGTTGLLSKTVAVDEAGRAQFSEVELGLYLITQPVAAAGYNPVTPFLVSVPVYTEDGTYVYEVDASPKVELVKKPVVPEEPTNPPTDPKLPQTGQLNWPIPVLAIAGLALCVLGWVLRSGKDSKRER